MSGHSKWANIKTRKLAQDQKRAQVFTKRVRAIAIAARENPDSDANPRLRLAIDRARSFNVPKENIERAIRREGAETVEAFSFDAVGPSGITMIIEGATDNRNRTLGEIRHILELHGAKLAPEGSARWAFARKGILTLETSQANKKRDDLLLALIAAGAEDVVEREGALEMIVAPDELIAIQNRLSAEGVAVADAALGWVPKQAGASPAIPDAHLRNLLAELDGHPDVQTVWSNES